MHTSMGTDTGGYNAPHFVPFDTLAISEELKASGVPSKQAKAHAQMMYNLISNNMATKMDVARIEERIELLRNETKSDIELLRKETKAEIATIKADMLKWIFPMLMAQLFAMAGLIKFLIN